MFQFILHTVPDSILFSAQGKTVLQSDDLAKEFQSPHQLIGLDSSCLFFQQETKTVIDRKSVENEYDGVVRDFSKSEISILLIIVFACFVVFSFIFRFSYKSITQSLHYFIPTKNPRINVYKEQITTSEIWGKFFLIFQALLFLSIVVCSYLFYQLQGSFFSDDYWMLLAGVYLIICLFFIVKYLLYKVTGALLFSSSFDDFIAHWLWLEGGGGIIYFIPILVHISLHQFGVLPLILVFATFFISRVFIYIKILGIFVKNKIDFLSFIVYLCSIEIAPFLVLYKGVVLLLNYI